MPLGHVTGRQPSELLRTLRPRRSKLVGVHRSMTRRRPSARPCEVCRPSSIDQEPTNLAALNALWYPWHTATPRPRLHTSVNRYPLPASTAARAPWTVDGCGERTLVRLHYRRDLRDNADDDALCRCNDTHLPAATICAQSRRTQTPWHSRKQRNLNDRAVEPMRMTVLCFSSRRPAASCARYQQAQRQRGQRLKRNLDRRESAA